MTHCLKGFENSYRENWALVKFFLKNDPKDDKIEFLNT